MSLAVSVTRWNKDEDTEVWIRISFQINEIYMNAYNERTALFDSGAIAVICAGESQVRIRSIEIQEMPRVSAGSRVQLPAAMAFNVDHEGDGPTPGARQVAWAMGRCPDRSGGGRADRRLGHCDEADRASTHASPEVFRSLPIGWVVREAERAEESLPWHKPRNPPGLDRLSSVPAP
jgi:hypothetical protein